MLVMRTTDAEQIYTEKILHVNANTLFQWQQKQLGIWDKISVRNSTAPVTTTYLIPGDNLSKLRELEAAGISDPCEQKNKLKIQFKSIF